MKRTTGLLSVIVVSMLMSFPVHGAPSDETLNVIKENVEKIELSPEELAREAKKLYEEYGDELIQKAGQLYEEYGEELVNKAQEIYEEQANELGQKASEIYEEKVSEVIEQAKKEVKKSFLESVGDFFSDMGASVVDFVKGLFG